MLSSDQNLICIWKILRKAHQLNRTKLFGKKSNENISQEFMGPNIFMSKMPF